MSDLPLMFRVRQTFERPRVDDISATVESQLAGLTLSQTVQPGQSVAITAGSRGIANIAVIIKAAVDHFKSLGAQPFIVPAMGSHGGGTAAGQQKIIEGYGITEQFCGCPIRASMETVVVCEAAEGFPVHFDKHAFEADHVVVCGRVKPHTGFTGDIESGLMKMMLIGLGKHAGAKIYHRAIKDHSFGQIVRSVAREVLAKCRIVAGLAIIENGYDETAQIAAVAPSSFEPREKELLVQAKQWMPRLPFARADLLLIDEIGKNISGTGMDTNIVGRKFLDHKAREDEFPKLRFIAIRGLTPETHGNATGIGLAEFALTRAVESVDQETTLTNCLTGGHPTAAMTPVHFANDAELLQRVLPQIGLTEPTNAKVLWIRNTLELAEVECSAAFLPELEGREDLERLTEPRPLQFDEAGNLSSVEALVGAG